jgi:hypothetical protein
LNPRNFLVTGGKDGRIFLWEVSNSQSESFPDVILKKKYKAHVTYVTSLAIGQKTGNVFVSCGGDGLIKLWNIAKQTCKTAKPHQKEVNFCRLNPNEKYVLSGSQDKQVILYSAKTLKIIRKLQAHAKGIWDGDFAPFELMFGTCSSDHLVKVWDLKYILDQHKRNDSLSANSGNLTSKGVSSLVSFSEKKGKALTEDQENDLLVKQVLSNHAENSISNMIKNSSPANAIEIEKSECLFTLEGHESPVIRIKWINMGLQVISGDSEGVIKLWNFRKATCLFSVHKHQGRIWSLDVFEDFRFSDGDLTSVLKSQGTQGIKILSGDNDCGLFLWSDNTHAVEAKSLEDRQRRKLIHTELELKMKDSKYKEALTMCFERKMNSWFFKSLQRWQKEQLGDWLVQSIVFSFDDYCRQLYLNLLKQSQLSLREQEFVREVQGLLEELFQRDPAHLLTICQSFVTHSKYAWTVQLVLHCLFGSCIQLGKLAELHDQLKEKKVDLNRILTVYLNFSEKLLRRNEQQTQIITKLNFDLKKNNLS